MSEPVRLRLDGDLRRRRAAVFLRLVLAVPPAAAVAAWTALAGAALALAWPATVVLGSTPRPLHRLLRRYLRALTQVTAWLALLSDSYPALWRGDAHPVQVEVRRAPQPRLSALLRGLLALPAIVLGSVLGVVLGGATVAAWLVALVLGRTTAGLQELGSFCLRYEVETLAYLLLLSSRYPALEAPQTPQ